MIQRLSDKQIQILQALGHYKFLTYQQMVRLGIAKQIYTLSRQVRDLRNHPSPLVGKIPNRMGQKMKHFLTRKGKDVLLELYPEMSEENIHFINRNVPD